MAAVREKQVSDLRSGLHPARKKRLSAAQQFTWKRQSGSRFAWKPVSPASVSAFKVLIYVALSKEKPDKPNSCPRKKEKKAEDLWNTGIIPSW
ncbi:hypothetical protein [Brevibacillus reuszeri]|uniref:hypothetical protein n=1 Tax=Brevibacillus reuszeri TaxID=54915 RepID=UPI002898B91F|nr:hypothetical protein [Brevibacillus reuszeri]